MRVLELNVVKKDWRKIPIKILLIYPNIYRVGMTSLAVQIIYGMVNERDDSLCERAFLPYQDSKITSLESGLEMKEFDIIAFSFQYETDYANALRILKMGGIPLFPNERGNKYPLLMAGGPCIWENPEPIADFFDLFFIGEAETFIDEFVDRFVEIGDPRANKEEFMDLKGVYIPSLGRHPVKRNWVKNLDETYYPKAQIIPIIEKGDRRDLSPVFGRSFLMEVVRGCGMGCKFCLIGHQCKPMRLRSLAKIKEIIDDGTEDARISKVAFIGSAVASHPKLTDICWHVINEGMKLSLSSIRVDLFNEEIAEVLCEGGQRTVTFAPETGSDRLRYMVGKRFDNDTIIRAASISKEVGIKNVKLYFIVGLPGEKEEDLKEVTILVRKIASLGFGGKNVRVGITPFIPKPHTPFQFEPQPSLEVLKSKIGFLKKELRKVGIKRVFYLDPRWAKIQAALSLGDRRLSKVIRIASEYGNTLRGWKKAQVESGIILSEYSDIRRDSKDEMPWSHIEV
ncbi:MAG: radical SAM protein [Candidatus Asgardarchaeia archaeon]